MSTPLDFAHLPLDIHLYVFRYLEPSEILGLRKTCKGLWVATQERTVWLEAVEAMCANNAVYRYSFPLDGMTLTDLEHAAMSPFKWESFVRKSDPSHLAMAHPPGRTFTLPCKPNRGPHRQRYVYLVPGGRFLLFLEDSLLMLWDLGYDPYGVEEIKLVAQTTVDCFSITTHSSPDGLSIRVFTLGPNSDDSALQCDMLQIDPHDTEPTFVTIASHITSCPHDVCFTSVCGDLVAFVFGPIIKIWDIKKNKCVSWNSSRDPLQILMNASFVVLIHYHNCTVWRIPEPSQWVDPHSWLDHATNHISEPLRSLPYEHEPLPLTIVDCYGLCDWYTGSPQPLWFDIQKSDVGTVDPTSHRFIADIDDPSPDNFSIKPRRSVQIPRRCVNEFMEPYRVCGNHLVAPWRTSESYHCHSQDVRTTAVDKEERLDKVVDLFHKDWWHERYWSGWPTYSLCPIAGRLVVARGRSNNVRVIDLFSPKDLESPSPPSPS